MHRKLPDDTILHMLSFFSARELAQSQLVSKNFVVFSNDPLLWQERIKKEFFISDPEVKALEDPKKRYVELTEQFKLEQEKLDIFLTAFLYSLAIKKIDLGRLVPNTPLEEAIEIDRLARAHQVRVSDVAGVANQSSERMDLEFKRMQRNYTDSIDMKNIHLLKSKLSVHKENINPTKEEINISFNNNIDDVNMFLSHVWQSFSICKTPLSLQRFLTKPGMGAKKETHENIFLFACIQGSIENVEILINKSNIDNSSKLLAIFSIFITISEAIETLSQASRVPIAHINPDFYKRPAEKIIKLLLNSTDLDSKCELSEASQVNIISIREWCSIKKSELKYSTITDLLDLIINTPTADEKERPAKRVRHC